MKNSHPNRIRHVRPSRYIYYIYKFFPTWYIYIFSAMIYIYIYIYVMYICITFPQSFVFCGSISAVIAILYSDFYPIYYSSSVLLHPTPYLHRRLLFRKGFPKSPRDTCPTFLSAAAVEPADEIHYSGRSIIISLRI